MPTIPNMILGISTAKRGGSPPFKANMVENCMNMMYAKLKKIPIPNGSPMPPRTLRDDRETPIRVRTNVEKG